ncbi:hypothetical protein FACS1894214_2550 [Planctomycetales bacterium]|nr:hypothetical protein FACS1894214_2550 [Planctomycetales bacterium]
MTNIIRTFFFLFAFTVSYSAGYVSAQNWVQHTENVKQQDGLIRYYLFDDSVAASKNVKNLAVKPDTENSQLQYKTNKPFEIVAGQFAETKAVRLDAGYFEAPKLSIEKSFTVEMRLRKTGQGTEFGNSGSTNGTLFGFGNGWDNGFRLTTDDTRSNLTFSIGRPTNEKSRNLDGNSPVPNNVWQHIAAVWDGEYMLLYVDGLLYGTIDYSGNFTEGCWGFRVGFNDAGVGSVKMDVAEVAVYQTALPPETIIQHVLLQNKLPQRTAQLYRNAVKDVERKDYTAASQNVQELLKQGINAEYKFLFQKFQIELAALSGNQTQALRLSASLLEEPTLKPEQRASLIYRFIPAGDNTPLAAASSKVYKQILDDKTIHLDGKRRFAVEKCYAEALFAEGKTAEAKTQWNNLKSKEAEIINESLKEKNLSDGLTDMYKNYRQNQKQLFQSAWEKPKPVLPFPVSFKPAKQFFVSPDGKADNIGSENSPFGSLTNVRDAIRKLKNTSGLPKGGIEVIIKSGVYPVSETFLLEQQDSGTADCPIVYRAAEKGKAIFNGGVAVKGFKKVEDAEILKRLPEESKDKIYVADVPNISQFPTVEPRGYGKNGTGAAPFVELFINNKPQQISRYPNAPKPNAADSLKESENAFMKTGKISRGFFNTPESGKPGIFEYSDNRHERWTQAADAMLFGYWGHLWGITSCKVEKTDTAAKQVILSTNNPYGYRENMPYYAFNLLEEIDTAGEWYLDRRNGKLYIFPPEGMDLNKTEVVLTSFPKNFIQLNNVSNITFYGLTFENGSGNAAVMNNCNEIRFAGCQFNRFGNWGLAFNGGVKHKVLSCDFVSLGGGGIHLNSGNYKTLSAGESVIENCVVRDFSRVDRAYAPAVLVDGCGNRIAHNLFCDSPAHAIRSEGMEQIFEFNEIHSVVYESDDQSGIDVWGNPFMRGLVIRYNYWHHIGSGRNVAGQSGIRLDDMISSVQMYGNVFFRSSGGHFGGVQIHGGKDNVVDNNLMIDCQYAVSFSPWGEKRWLDMLDNNFGKRARETGFNPDSEVYRNKYSDYAELRQNADRNFILRNAAIGCTQFARNGGRNVLLENAMLPWLPDLFTETKGMSKIGENRVPADARKVRQRLSIPKDSPLYDFLGIEPLPLPNMGTYIDGIRTEQPVSEITPFFVLE